MKKSVVVFESEGGSDKWLDGHRKDTLPIANSLKSKGWDCQVIYYRDEWKDEIINFVKDKFDAYVSRINPGSLPNGETGYFETMRKLTEHGLLGMSHPDVMITLGSKDALIKFTNTELVPSDTCAYYDLDSLKKNFPKTLSLGERVLKQNRGSTGEGIWRVQVVDAASVKPGEEVPLTAQIKCTEAVDNHVEFHNLGDFMNFCDRYLQGENGMLLDMIFLPRIKEGEIRILLVGDRPVFVVHKKPAETADAFSATLFSGAKYTYQSPEQWTSLLDSFRTAYPVIAQITKGHGLPLIWTADFILDTDPSGKDKYILGEINCSCVGFTSHLNQGIQDMVAEEIIKQVEAKYKQNN